MEEPVRYPVVLLDVGETLIGPRDSFGAVYSAVLEDMGLPLPGEALERGLRETWRELDRAIPPGTDRYSHFPGGEREYWMRFTRSTLAKASSSEVREPFVGKVLDRLAEAFRKQSVWRVYPDVPPALEGLRNAGVRMGVVSNWDSNLPRLLERLGLDHFFDVIGVSHLEGIEKPAPDFFRRVLGRMGASAGQALHVGDVFDLDIAGANAAGLDGLLVDRKGKLESSKEAVADLSDLPRIAREGGNAVIRRS
jgi:putative hydrolase of the HAD superfamily